MSGMATNLLKSELLVHLGDSSLEDSIQELLLNRAWWAIQEELKLPNNDIYTTFSTVISQSAYAITYPVDAIYDLAYEDADTQTTVPIDEESKETYDKELSTDPTVEGKPEKYHVFGPNLYIRPVPDAIYVVRIRRKEMLSDLTGSAAVATANSLHEVILLGAVHRGFLRQRDYNSADRIKREFESMLAKFVPTEVKNEANWKYAQVQPVRSPYNLK